MTTTVQPIDFSVDLLRAILWQYDEAPNLKALIEAKQAWYVANQQDFWQDWLANVFDLRTANSFGLEVWSIILDIPIVVTNFPETGRTTWGFGTLHENFTRGNFSGSTGHAVRLADETARILLQLRYFQLTSAGTVPEINRMLAYVFQDYGPAWLNDNHDMTQFYTFGFALPSDLEFLFNNFDVLPRPAGVGSSYRVIVGESWGFGDHHENFDHGNFSEL